jgi:hypothetical protein
MYFSAYNSQLSCPTEELLAEIEYDPVDDFPVSLAIVSKYQVEDKQSQSSLFQIPENTSYSYKLTKGKILMCVFPFMLSQNPFCLISQISEHFNDTLERQLYKTKTRKDYIIVAA